jgi:hypothetical protein
MGLRRNKREKSKSSQNLMKMKTQPTYENLKDPEKAVL